LKHKTYSHIRVKVIWFSKGKLVKNADDAVYADCFWPISRSLDKEGVQHKLH